jgi:hypothetical protein
MFETLFRKRMNENKEHLFFPELDEYKDFDERYARAGLIEKRISKRFQKKVFEYFKVDRCGPHSFRRTFCTDLYNRGVKLEHIQRLLRHASVDDSLRYISSKVINEEVDKLLVDVFVKNEVKAKDNIEIPSFKCSVDDESVMHGLMEPMLLDDDIYVEDSIKNLTPTLSKMEPRLRHSSKIKTASISSTQRRRSIKRQSKDVFN